MTDMKPHFSLEVIDFARTIRRNSVYVGKTSYLRELVATGAKNARSWQMTVMQLHPHPDNQGVPVMLRTDRTMTDNRNAKTTAGTRKR